MTIDIHFTGERFYPSIIKNELLPDLDIHCEYGVIVKIGRYKGQPCPYGLAILIMPEELEVKCCYEFFDRYINLLYDNREILKRSGLGDVEFSINSNYIFNIRQNLFEKLISISGSISNNPFDYE